MKKLLLCLMFIGSTTWANPPDYKTLFLLQWVYNCSENLKPSYMIRGFDQATSLQMSIHSCSCVIDQFREYHPYGELIIMTDQDRLAFSERYAKICSGVVEST